MPPLLGVCEVKKGAIKYRGEERRVNEGGEKESKEFLPQRWEKGDERGKTIPPGGKDQKPSVRED